MIGTTCNDGSCRNSRLLELSKPDSISSRVTVNAAMTLQGATLQDFQAIGPKMKSAIARVMNAAPSDVEFELVKQVMGPGGVALEVEYCIVVSSDEGSMEEYRQSIASTAGLALLRKATEVEAAVEIEALVDFPHAASAAQSGEVTYTVGDASYQADRRSGGSTRVEGGGGDEGGSSLAPVIIGVVASLVVLGTAVAVGYMIKRRRCGGAKVRSHAPVPQKSDAYDVTLRPSESM